MIVPLLTAPGLLQRMMSTIDYPVAELVIIDNGAGVKRGDLETWRTPYVQRMHLLSMPSNLGVAGSWNLGIKATPHAPWWLVVNFDTQWPAGSLEAFADAADRHGLVLSGGAPVWCAFALGDSVVERVGLFDEALHPAYMEDLDFQRRVEHSGMKVTQTAIPVHHDNSSTIKEPKYRERNDATFHDNLIYYRAKADREDYTAGEWSLARRRANSWD